MASVYCCRVLVADDNAEWRQILTRTLEAEHTVVGYAERGDRIIDVARDLLPDVVTLDVSMPGQSGLMVLPSLRLAVPDASIIVVTTTDTRLYRAEAFARGADAYVTKRRVLSDLLPAIRSAYIRLSERRQRPA